jgi:hypothetical protein
MDHTIDSSSKSQSGNWPMAFDDVYSIASELELNDKWTPALELTATDYLTNRITVSEFAAFVKLLNFDTPGGSRKTKAQLIVKQHQPGPIGIALYEAHIAVVSAKSSLEHVVGKRQTWTERLQDDAAIWLEHHATIDQLVRVARDTANSDLVPRRDEPRKWHKTYENDIFLELTARLPCVLAPQALLNAWSQAGSKGSVAIPNGSAMVRAWAKRNGIQIGRRGRIRAEIVRLYLQHNL